MPSKNHTDLTEIWPRYCDNLLRHLSRVNRHTELRLMNYLTDCGYSRLAMNYAQPLSTLSMEELTPSELARRMGISKQLCAQSLRPIYAEGYIQQRANPDDRRSRLIALTDRGRALVDDAMNELVRINLGFNETLGAGRNKQLGEAIVSSYGKKTATDTINNWSATNIGFLSRRLNLQFLQLLSARGHNALQPSFHQVLFNIDLGGTSVAELAGFNAVTGQAISRIARELETLGYIERRENVRDNRSRTLHLAARGIQFIGDAVAAIDLQSEQLTEACGKQTLGEMRASILMLHEALEPERLLKTDIEVSDSQFLPASCETEPANKPDAATLLLYLISLLDRDETWLTALRNQPHAPVRASDRLQRILRQKVIEPERVEAELVKLLGHAEVNNLRGVLQKIQEI